MTFLELQQAVYADINAGSTPATAVSTRIKRYLNDGMRQVLAEPGMARLQDSDAPFTVASVASQARYVLPAAVEAIRGISERTNDITLDMLDLNTYRRRNPDPASNTGVPTHYVPFGRTAVAVQPSNASRIFAVSTAAGDTTQTVRLEGIITGGYHMADSITMNGTVGAGGTQTTFIELTDVYLSAVGVGTITIVEDSAIGTVLATIPIGALRPRYTGFYLDPTPSSAIDYLVDYRRRTMDMAQDTDEPSLPEDFHPMLAAYARWREYEKTADTRYKSAQDQFDVWLSRLKHFLMETPDHLPVAGRRSLHRGSRLGAYFPADTW